jgi:Arf-GAP/coiled-coil/ANK repeat/PH domain-containing protein
MVLQALTAWDMDQWLTVIQNAKFSHLTSGEDISTSITCDTVYADCGASNSSWTSINWAVTLCEACAGVDRGLGANVSKMRSLALDHVEPLHRALIEAIGSVRANEILTARCPPEEAIGEDAEIEKRQHFIDRKYRERAFAAEWDDGDVMAAIQGQELMTVFRFVAAGKLVECGEGGFGPLHAAACVGNPLVLHLLCLNTSEIGALDDAGWSPLCYAAYHGQALMADVLLFYGADLQKKGVSPYEIARARGHETLMRRLTALAQPTVLGNDETGCQLPHQEIVPALFQLRRFVADPAVYEAPRRNELDLCQFRPRFKFKLINIVWFERSITPKTPSWKDFN